MHEFEFIKTRLLLRPIVHGVRKPCNYIIRYATTLGSAVCEVSTLVSHHYESRNTDAQ